MMRKIFLETSFPQLIIVHKHEEIPTRQHRTAYRCGKLTWKHQKEVMERINRLRGVQGEEEAGEKLFQG